MKYYKCKICGKKYSVKEMSEVCEAKHEMENEELKYQSLQILRKNIFQV